MVAAENEEALIALEFDFGSTLGFFLIFGVTVTCRSIATAMGGARVPCVCVCVCVCVFWSESIAYQSSKLYDTENV